MGGTAVCQPIWTDNRRGNVVVWIIASIGFSTYVENFGNYGATYGSLGGMIVLLLYFFVSSAVLLLGAEINAVIHPAHGPRSENVTPGQ
ncbi:MAG: ribonuclease [Thermomicrobiales bacterium]|nr:ribonuclease [Thermomicrobiales bacterium]